MAKTNLGKVGLTPKKAYSASITYERLDFVTAGDSSYVSLQDNNLGHPVTDGAWWQVLASGAASTEAATAALAAAEDIPKLVHRRADPPQQHTKNGIGKAAHVALLAL
mgnify:CR=1 FL=1|jgi:hypothetical protein